MTRAAKKPVEKISEKKPGTNPECPSKSSKVRTPARRPKTEPVARLEPADEQVAYDGRSHPNCPLRRRDGATAED